ncbi:hypothetical protein ACQR0Z_00045 [Bradyrhizobium sp. HKCCYLS3077]|uniref:hypothetical protein n=1 Tax=Bradyrhizobium sp. HKCCYLS3077 TaxID=3420761 RepID=UPI003EB6D4A6
MTSHPDQPGPNLLEALEREKARLLEQATAKIEREMAEIARLAVAYPDAFKAIAKQMGLEEVKEPPASSIATLGELVDRYRTSPTSPFQKLKHTSREHYDTLLNLIRNDFGGQKLSEADANTLDAWYAKWREGGKIAVSHSKMVMLRNLFSFGTTSVRDENCARLYGLLGNMEIELPKARNEQLTREQANLIRAKAHEKNRPSIALAQAFQSDVGLTQKEVIGEWAPMSEPGISDVIEGNMKWVRGLRWEEIDRKQMTLTHLIGDKEVTIELKKYPMVMEELERVRTNHSNELPMKGPMIASEYDGLPWSAVEFRRWWRLLADACGIPKHVRNSDSRAKGSAAAAESGGKNMSGGLS